jgi:orotidine-5'-phosphate decarboxylase
MIDKLIERIFETKNPSAVGLDTCLEYLPNEMLKGINSFENAAAAILEFNKNIIDEIYDIVPAVKVQIAYYEMYSFYGLKAFFDTIVYAKQKGMIVIADIKRNDIGSTAGCYSKAYLGETKIDGNFERAFPSDMITINGYLGSDGITPFIEDIKKFDKGAFVLCRTSNPSGGELQNLKLENGQTIYEYMGELIEKWGATTIGNYGYSDLGAVVGATHPAEAKKLREQMPHTFFLIPGYGYQGGSAKDLKVCFDNSGLGGIVNSSRGILCAYKLEKYMGKNYYTAARQASIDMKNDITSHIIIRSAK